MPNPKTAIEEWQEEERKLRGERLGLEREIGDKLQELNMIYARYVKPNAAEAKLIQAALRSGEKPLSPEQAKFMVEGGQTATQQFEWGRSEMARLDKLIRAQRTRLQKVEARLEQVRGHLRARSRSGLDGYLGELFRSTKARLA